MKIFTDLSIDAITLTARVCGFNAHCDHAPGADAWTLSAGHGDTFVLYAGSRRDVCAFLAGYSAMREKAIMLALGTANAQKAVIDGVIQQL